MDFFNYRGTKVLSSSFAVLPVVKVTGTIPTTKSDADVQTVEISFSSDEISFTCWASMKVQGNTTALHPKKNYNIKLYEDAELQTKKKVKFRNWKSGNKFTIKSNYTDYSQARNIVAANIFTEMYKARADYSSLPSRIQSSPVAIDGFPVQVYLNDVYYGVYTWNLPKDAIFGIDDDVETECLIMGSTSNASINTSVSSWTDETHDVTPAAVTEAWTDMLDFIANSSDSEFESGIDDRIDLLSIIDQFLLITSTCAIDNLGNNVVFASYNLEKWYGSMYDMDKSFGNTGAFENVVLPLDPFARWPLAENIPFKLYNRVFKIFYDEVKARYIALRDSALKTENVINALYDFSQQIPAGMLEKNFAPETGGGAFVTNTNRNDIAQAIGFSSIRLGYIDAWFDTDYFKRVILLS